MSTQQPDIEDVVSRLVAVGRERGEPDRYLGKRRWTRWTARIRLEVASDPSDPSDSWPAAMHNVSRGGVGFWSKRAFQPGHVLCIREWGQDQPWLAVRVVHCTESEDGLLVGAEFDNQASSE
ncbi:MAG: PilZ domain-containing protein [Planctomycetota bacterium]|jgi:hypothetical protein